MLNLRVKSVSWKAFSVILFSFILIFSAPLPFALASSKSPYDSGYDHGCDDAGISDSSEQYINQPEKGPNYHTSEFMDGYYTGFDDCSYNLDSSSSSESDRSYPQDNTYEESVSDNEFSPYNEYENKGPAVNWENICLDSEFLLGLDEPCSAYANGTQLTEKG